MNILALNPFHGGSHKAFLEGWAKHSCHTFEILGLPARKWKWRMRHAPVEFARQLANDNLSRYDVLFTTDMLDLATLRGLLPSIAQLPTVVYFHENQLMYPSRAAENQRQRDMHFAFTNVLSAAAANAVWFNSTWHRESFITAARDWLGKMPDYPPTQLMDAIEKKAFTQYPGVDSIGTDGKPADGPLTIAWVSRWEHDKNPDTFFDAIRLFKQRGVDFRLNVLGESYRRQPACFENAKTEFAERINQFGFAENRLQYQQLLQQSDVVVSTAVHEFFGLAIVEAVSAGCIPLLPSSLAYPEVFNPCRGIFHRNTAADLCEQLAVHAAAKASGRPVIDHRTLTDCASRYAWPTVAKSLDANILSLPGNA
ncbi:MAG: DUF3524 domain-containing protein [Planctomycetaceae bacterium]